LQTPPDSPGSLGIAISETIEDAAGHDDTHYSLGSVPEPCNAPPDSYRTGSKGTDCAGRGIPGLYNWKRGRGSNFAGLSFPFLMDKIAGKKDMEVIGVESKACPSLTGGEFRYDFGDTAGLTPLLKMYTMGHEYIPPAISCRGSAISRRLSYR